MSYEFASETESEEKESAAPVSEPVDAPVEAPAETDTVKAESSNEPTPVSEPVEAPVKKSEATDKPTQPSEPFSVAALAIRAAVTTFVAIVLLFGSVLCFAPYTAMRFYDKLDKPDMAIYFAEKYMHRHADEYDSEKGKFPGAFSKYADALYYATNASIKRMQDVTASQGMDSADAEYYARKADTHATAYLDGRLTERTARVDSYNILHTQPALHPYVYSYVDSLETSRFRAWQILGKTADISEKVQTATTAWNVSSGEWTPSEDDLANAMQFFSMLSAYIEGEFSRLDALVSYTDNTGKTPVKYTLTEALAAFTTAPLHTNSITANLYEYKPFALFIDAHGAFTGLYDDVTARFATFRDAIKDNATVYTDPATRDVSKHLQYTYYLKCFKDFALDMGNMTSVLAAGRMFYDADRRDALSAAARDYEQNYQVSGVRVTRNGITQSNLNVNLGEWYNWGMLHDYLDFFRTPSAS